MKKVLTLVLAVLLVFSGVAAFAEGWQNFVAGLASIAVVLAGLWPVVVIVAAVAAAVVIVRIRRRR